MNPATISVTWHLQSGYFHRFACTVHSPVGRNPEEYGIRLKPLPAGGFAKNDVQFIDPTGVDHQTLGERWRWPAPWGAFYGL